MAGYITVLLQKSNPAGDWGFKMGPVEPAASVVITQIDQTCVAAELLEAGDKIVEIEGMETSKLSVEELQGLLGNPSKKLSMVVLKKNLPKGNCTIRKTTTEEVQTVEETREEIERKKEYEVLLEVSPSESVEDVIKNIKGKIERGEKLDAKELQITSSINKNVQKSTSTIDQTKHTIQRDFGTTQQSQMLDQHKSTEIMKRKEKYLRERKKEELIQCEKFKGEKQISEEKKKTNSFWTDPPSDLKNVIKINEFWKNRVDEPYTTSDIFRNLNDLHNTLKKGSPRDEKRQFWENCRKKYGWDPPATKYNVSHRSHLIYQQDDNRSRSCEPEHLATQNPFKREDYRQTNPFYSPSPTNPFYSDCRGKASSDEKLCGSAGLSQPPKSKQNIPSQITKPQIDSSTQNRTTPIDRPTPATNIVDEKRRQSFEGTTKELLDHEYGEKIQQSNEAYREDFTSKCEFFERATSVPTTSCVKNAQDLVSERLGTPERSPLKKPSDFINQMQENRRASLTRSSSKEETAPESFQESIPPPEPDTQSAPSVPEPNGNDPQSAEDMLSEHKAFLGQSVLRQSVTGSMSTSNKPVIKVDLAPEIVSNEQDLASKEASEKMMYAAIVTSTTTCEKKRELENEKVVKDAKPVSQPISMENEIKNHPLVIAAQQKEYAASQINESNLESTQENMTVENKYSATKCIQETTKQDVAASKLSQSSHQFTEQNQVVRKEYAASTSKQFCQESTQQKEFAASESNQSNQELTRQVISDKIETEVPDVSNSTNQLLQEVNDKLVPMSLHMQETAKQIEAQMKESIDRIKAESEKLYSLDIGRDIEQPRPIGFSSTQSELERFIIPDSTAFPGMTISRSGEFRKRSFTETSYEKVTRTGTPYENVESACKREFRVATPSGFNENAGTEEVFRQETMAEGIRTAQGTIDVAIREVGPAYDCSCAYTNEGMARGDVQGGNGAMIEAGSK